MEKSLSFQQMVLGKLDILMQKKEIKLIFHTSYAKVNSKCMKELNVKDETIQMLKKT